MTTKQMVDIGQAVSGAYPAVASGIDGIVIGSELLITDIDATLASKECSISC